MKVLRSIENLHHKENFRLQQLESIRLLLDKRLALQKFTKKDRTLKVRNPKTQDKETIFNEMTLKNIYTEKLEKQRSRS